MLAKKNPNNQVVLPKTISDQFPGVEHFAIRTDGDRIILDPVRLDRAREVRERSVASKTAWWSNIKAQCRLVPRINEPTCSP